MVMEAANPSPQSVGREFVRQYYTLLNNAPAHLHRFYNNYSSFIHGGLDSNKESTPAIGQKQIHQKIQALNFQDCHAKINQVDSQMTLSNGVVVQVSGELSNAGHPMRRFTQTFVLAPQAPKKYYVHNDIFRYQDYGYVDEEEEELEGESHNEVAEREVESDNIRAEIEEESQINQAQLSKLANLEHNQTQQPPQLSQQQMYYSMPPQQQIPPGMQQVTINGSVHEDSSIMSQQPIQQQAQFQQSYISEPATQEHFQPEPEQESQSQQQQQQTQPMKVESAPEESERTELETNYTQSGTETEIEHQQPAQPTNSGPKTYANLVKSTVGTTSPLVIKQSMSPPPIQNLRIDDRIPSQQQQSGGSHPSGGAPLGQHVHRMGVPQQQSQQQQYQQRLPRSNMPMQRDGDRRPNRPGYTDAHQLFLGNLPHNATENDLRQVFERFGRVTDLRVHSKQNDRTKGPQGQNNTRVPNYGFITFEDSTVVAKVLESCPIYFPDENGHKLNVEEKKFRSREPGSRPSLGGDNNMRPMGQQQQQQPQQRGPGGPGGMMRGGPRPRGGGGGYNRGGEGNRGSLGRQPGGNPNNQNYQNRR